MVSVEQRLVDLEGRYRRLARWNTALLLGLVVAASLAAAAPQASPQQTRQQSPSNKSGSQPGRPQPPAAGRVVEAEAFVLRDAAQRIRGRMGVVGEQAVFTLYDEHGLARLTLAQQDDGAEVRLVAAGDGCGVRLRADALAEGSRVEVMGDRGRSTTAASGVSVCDADGGQRLVMKLINGNFPLLGVSQQGQVGPPSVEITAGDEGTRKIALHTPTGEPLIAITSSGREGTLALRQLGSEQTLQVHSGSTPGEGPGIVILAPERANGGGGVLPRLLLGLRREGEPFLQLNGADGRPVAMLPQATTEQPSEAAD